MLYSLFFSFWIQLHRTFDFSIEIENLSLISSLSASSRPPFRHPIQWVCGGVVGEREGR